MPLPITPVVGYLKGNRYQVTFETTEEGDARIAALEACGDKYAPTEVGFRSAGGHEVERGLSRVKKLPTGRYAVVKPGSDEPVTATATNIDVDQACEFAAKQAAAAVLRDRQMRGM